MERFLVFGAAANGCRTAATVVWLVAACAISGCDENGEGRAPSVEASCAARVIVRFAAAPDAAALADIERANEIELAPLVPIADDIRAYSLRASGLDADCRAAIERLRSDPRVRSVERDVRRGLHDAEPTTGEELR